MNDGAGSRRRLLLIGSSGRVGSMVLKYWRKFPPHDLAIISQRRTPNGADSSTIIWDLIAPPPSEIMDREAETTVVVLAGVTPASNAPLQMNRDIAISCLEAARLTGANRILFSSSSSVYGPGAGTPIDERYQPDQQNAYGDSKLAMEAAILERAGDIDFSILRIGNVLGADALMTAARKLGPREVLSLDQFDDGTGPVRSYIDPAVLASVIVSLARHRGPLPKLLNVACPAPVSMQALAEAGGVPWHWSPAPRSSHQRIVLDCTLLQAFHAFEQNDCEPSHMMARLKMLDKPE